MQLLNKVLEWVERENADMICDLLYADGIICNNDMPKN